MILATLPRSILWTQSSTNRPVSQINALPDSSLSRPINTNTKATTSDLRISMI